MTNKFIREKLRPSVQHHPSTPVTAMTALTAMKMEKIQGNQQLNIFKMRAQILFMFMMGVFSLKSVKEGEVELKGGGQYKTMLYETKDETKVWGGRVSMVLKGFVN